MKIYTTITDARTELENSGVNEYVTEDAQREAVIKRMHAEDESPEKAVAEELELDEADRKALGV